MFFCQAAFIIRVTYSFVVLENQGVTQVWRTSLVLVHAVYQNLHKLKTVISSAVPNLQNNHKIL